MLVGAARNAGNQAAVLVIRGLATGEITARSYGRYLLGECQMASSADESRPMVVAGYCRVKSGFGRCRPGRDRHRASLMTIVVSSVILG